MDWRNLVVGLIKPTDSQYNLARHNYEEAHRSYMALDILKQLQGCEKAILHVDIDYCEHAYQVMEYFEKAGCDVSHYKSNKFMTFIIFKVN